MAIAMAHRWATHWIGGCLVVLLACVPALAKDKAKERTYAFTAPPLEIYDRLPPLKLGEIPVLPEDERKLLTQVWELRHKQKDDAELTIDDALLLDALLIASGVETAEARQSYRQQFDALVAKTRAAVKEAKSPRESGERLMKLLHAEVMKGGYVEEQTSFADVFDTGKYNCVSSTAMYYAVGSQLGLKLKPFSIPGSEYQAGHASLDLIDGNKRLQVEPTNPDGFDWQTKIKQPGVRVYGFVPDRKNGHEIDPLGIAASIYSNRGVALVKDEQNPRQWEATRCFLSALALDPTDEAATNNLLSIFINAGPKLAEEQKFEEGLKALAFGLSIASQSDKLHDNQVAVWSMYIQHTLAAGKDKEAIELVRRAAKAEPKERDFQSASTWFGRRSYEVAKTKSWEAGLEVVERGLAILDGNERKGLLERRNSLFRQWSQSSLENQDADGSLKVLTRAYALDPKDKEIREGIGYHTHEALKFLEAKSGLPAAIEHAQVLRKEFPDVENVGENCWAVALEAVNDLTKVEKFAEAVAAAKKYQPLLATTESQAELGAAAYDGWGRSLAEKKDFKAALEKYAGGLKAFPGQKHLVQNTVATVAEWAEPAIKEKKWDEAIDIYDAGLKVLPGNKSLQRNKEFCQKMKAREK